FGERLFVAILSGQAPAAIEVRLRSPQSRAREGGPRVAVAGLLAHGTRIFSDGQVVVAQLLGALPRSIRTARGAPGREGTHERRRNGRSNRSDASHRRG